MSTGAYTILGGVPRSTIINGDGVWYYSAYNNLYGFSNPQNEQRGTINAPVKLMFLQLLVLVINLLGILQ